MTIKEILKASEDLYTMIFDLSMQPRFTRADSHRLDSLRCDIQSAINLIAAIDADASSLFNPSDDLDNVPSQPISKDVEEKINEYLSSGLSYREAIEKTYGV